MEVKRSSKIWSVSSESFLPNMPPDRRGIAKDIEGIELREGNEGILDIDGMSNSYSWSKGLEKALWTILLSCGIAWLILLKSPGRPRAGGVSIL